MSSGGSMLARGSRAWNARSVLHWKTDIHAGPRSSAPRGSGRNDLGQSPAEFVTRVRVVKILDSGGVSLGERPPADRAT